jgi:hypothetical protein
MPRLSRLLPLWLLLGAALASVAEAESFRVVYSFDRSLGAPHPYAVAMVGSKIFGTAQDDKYVPTATSGGYLYSVDTTGAGFSVLHSFVYPGDGAPVSGLTAYGSTLYGMAADTPYTFRPDTGSYHSVGRISDIQGQDGYGNQYFPPLGATSGVTVSNSRIYGTTDYGGGYNPDFPNLGSGTVFSMNVDGSDGRIVHGFSYAGPFGSGGFPRGVVAVNDTYGNAADFSPILFGAAGGGLSDNGSGRFGSIYQITNPNGPAGTNGFAMLHPFNGLAGVDGFPNALSLVNADLARFRDVYYDESMQPIEQESTFGKVVLVGAATNQGTVFRMEVNYNGFLDYPDVSFQTLHVFTQPFAPKLGKLTVVGDTIYGSTADYIFSVKLDGSDFKILHTFVRTPGELTSYVTDLTYADHFLYGATSFGGDNNAGMLFALAIPEPGSFALACILLGLIAAPVARTVMRRS